MKKIFIFLQVIFYLFFLMIFIHLIIDEITTRGYIFMFVCLIAGIISTMLYKKRLK